jgi:rhodanese-related sulfurtransferase
VFIILFFIYHFKNQLTNRDDFTYHKNMFFQLFGSHSELNMSPQEVKVKLDQGKKIVLVDVREPWEVAINRLEGSVHIPLADLGQRYKELDSQAEVISYCHMGVRSMKATQFLKQQGFEKARNLEGGIDAWSLKVDPAVPRYR